MLRLNINERKWYNSFTGAHGLKGIALTLHVNDRNYFYVFFLTMFICLPWAKACCLSLFILKSVFHCGFWNIVHLLMKTNSSWCYVSHVGCMKAFSGSLISVVYSSEAAREQFHAQQPLCVASCWCPMWLDMKVRWTKPGFMWAHLLAPCKRQNRRGHIDVVRIMLRNPVGGNPCSRETMEYRFKATLRIEKTVLF